MACYRPAQGGPADKQRVESRAQAQREAAAASRSEAAAQSTAARKARESKLATARELLDRQLRLNAATDRPDMVGYQVTKELKARPGTARRSTHDIGPLDAMELRGGMPGFGDAVYDTPPKGPAPAPGEDPKSFWTGPDPARQHNFSPKVMTRTGSYAIGMCRTASGSPSNSRAPSPKSRGMTPTPSTARGFGAVSQGSGPHGKAPLRETRSESPLRGENDRSKGKAGDSVRLTPTERALRGFYEWAAESESWALIEDLFYRNDMHQFVVSGTSGRHHVTFDEWESLLVARGFTGDPCLIFREIAKESRTTKDDPGLWGNRTVHTVSLQQFKRFEHRMMQFNLVLRANHEGSPASRLAQLLLQKRGSSLRGFRLDLDARQTGRVARTDFAAACRKLGLSGQQIWRSLRPEGNEEPLEFHDIDPQEAENLESFADILWETSGFDLHKAWSFMDSSNQNFLTYDDFRAAARRLGFQGDTKIIFRGLNKCDMELLDFNTRKTKARLDLESLEYLQKVTRAAQGRLLQSSHLLHELISWVQRELGGVDVLIVKLGLSEACPEISVSDLSARLTALGFPGDSLYVSTRMARYDGGTSVTGDTLYSLLSGYRRPPRTPAEKHRVPLKPRARGKQAWKDGVADIAGHNGAKPTSQRSYFSTPARDEFFLQSEAQRPKRQQPATRSLEGRPGWDASVYAVSDGNTKKNAHSKTYFSSTADKPVRDEILRGREARAEALSERCDALDSTYASTRLDEDWFQDVATAKQNDMRDDMNVRAAMFGY